MKWIDVSSYRQGDTERKPTSWSLKPMTGFSITVTSNHIYHKDEWVMHCEPWFDTHPIGHSKMTAEEAQRVALDRVRAKLSQLNAALETV